MQLRWHLLVDGYLSLALRSSSLVKTRSRPAKAGFNLQARSSHNLFDYGLMSITCSTAQSKRWTSRGFLPHILRFSCPNLRNKALELIA